MPGKNISHPLALPDPGGQRIAEGKPRLLELERKSHLGRFVWTV